MWHSDGVRFTLRAVVPGESYTQMQALTFSHAGYREVVGERPVFLSLLDKVLGKILTPEADGDPGKPFTPPPSLPSAAEEKDDDEDGPSFPMSPALA